MCDLYQAEATVKRISIITFKTLQFAARKLQGRMYNLLTNSYDPFTDTWLFEGDTTNIALINEAKSYDLQISFPEGAFEDTSGI